MGWLRNKVFAVATRALTKPRGNYTLLLPNDFDALLRVTRPGDVILVDGDRRVTQVIKYRTQSPGSPSVLYVGDELLRRFPAEREALVARHGRDAEHMMIEALLEGVLASPLSKYASFNLRICRPVGLQREDLQRILDEVIAQIGLRYDVKHILDLARYFFPVSLIPRRFRRRALQFGSGLTTQVICSSIIGRAFQNVGRSEEHTSELQSQSNLVCRLLLEKKNTRRRMRASRYEEHKVVPQVQRVDLI